MGIPVRVDDEPSPGDVAGTLVGVGASALAVGGTDVITFCEIDIAVGLQVGVDVGRGIAVAVEIGRMMVGVAVRKT